MNLKNWTKIKITKFLWKESTDRWNRRDIETRMTLNRGWYMAHLGNCSGRLCWTFDISLAWDISCFEKYVNMTLTFHLSQRCFGLWVICLNQRMNGWKYVNSCGRPSKIKHSIWMHMAYGNFFMILMILDLRVALGVPAVPAGRVFSRKLVLKKSLDFQIPAFAEYTSRGSTVTSMRDA